MSNDKSENNPTNEPAMTPAQLRRVAATMQTEAAKLSAKADALDYTNERRAQGDDDDTAESEPDELLFEAEPLDAEGYLTTDALRRRQVWLAIGYLVRAGMVKMPNFDLLHESTRRQAVDHMNAVYNDVLGLLELLDGETL